MRQVVFLWKIYLHKIVNDRIKLEYGDGVILMDGSGNTISTGLDGSPITPYDEDAGFAVTFETEFRNQPLLAMETI